MCQIHPQDNGIEENEITGGIWPNDFLIILINGSKVMSTGINFVID